MTGLPAVITLNKTCTQCGVGKYKMDGWVTLNTTKSVRMFLGYMNTNNLLSHAVYDSENANLFDTCTNI